MKKIQLVVTLNLLILIVLFQNVVAQDYKNVKISDLYNPEEPSIMINPLNTLQLVAGANINNVYYSSDGGETWIVHRLVSDYGVWGDPCIMVDTASNFYYFHLANPPNGAWIDRIVCQRSSDGGKTWTKGSYMGLNGKKAQDKEWATIDRRNNTIYATWTQFDKYDSQASGDSSTILFSKSANLGDTWSAPIRLSKRAGDCLDDDLTVEGAVPAVGANGELYVTWAGNNELRFDRSLDGGDTWLDDDIFVSDMPAGWTYDIPGIYRCNGLPITVCDTSQSRHRGTIYVNWTDQRNGSDDTDVWLVKSNDQGNTWSKPIRVNDDIPGKQQFLTWMTIDQSNGNIYAVFYDRRNYSDTQTDVYLAFSTDGGEHFTNQKISESPFTPDKSVFFGDYTNITAYNGKVRPIWVRLDAKGLSIYTAIIDF